MSTIEDFAYASPFAHDSRHEDRLSPRAAILTWFGLALAGWAAIGSVALPLVSWLA